MTIEWVPFVQSNYAAQVLPVSRRYVLVQTWPTERNGTRDPDCMRPTIAVGYLKYGAGDPDSPYFVVPSVGGEVVAWCDCLGDEAQEHGVLWQVAL